MNQSKKLVVVGGGAAGVFAAIRAAELGLSVILLEKSPSLLSKVLLSGGGRCNLTNATFDIHSLSQNYPRGKKELLSSFSRFSSNDVMEWFTSHGVSLSVEERRRVFPQSNRAQTIVDCFFHELHRFSVDVRLDQEVRSIERKNGGFEIFLATPEPLQCDFLLLATGNSRDGYAWAESLGHTIVSPVPSLFSFEIDPFSLKDLSGISVREVVVSLDSFQERGSLLITHFGLSGPAILNLSSWAARFLYERSYLGTLVVNWAQGIKKEEIFRLLKKQKSEKPLAKLGRETLFSLPHRLWMKLLEESQLSLERSFAQLSDKELWRIAEKLSADSYAIKNRRSDGGELVFCGGIHLKEVDSKTFESRKVPHLFFAGEILDVDGIAGGFNLQHAWTSGWVAASSLNRGT